MRTEIRPKTRRRAMRGGAGLETTPTPEAGTRTLSREDFQRTAASALVTLVMSRATTARPGLSLDALATLLLDHGAPAVPIVDEQGMLLGIVTKSDLLRGYRAEDFAPQPPVCEPYLGQGLHLMLAPTTAGEIMTTDVYSIPESAVLSEAIELMAFEGVRFAPVVSAEGRVVGILSALDVLRWLSGIQGASSGRGERG